MDVGKRKGQFEHDGAADSELEVAADRRAEAGQCRGHLVRADGQVWRFEAPVVIGEHRPDKAGRDVPDVYLGPRQGCLGLIHDGSADGAGCQLRERVWLPEQGCQQHQSENAPGSHSPRRR